MDNSYRLNTEDLSDHVEEFTITELGNSKYLKCAFKLNLDGYKEMKPHGLSDVSNFKVYYKQIVNMENPSDLSLRMIIVYPDEPPKIWMVNHDSLLGFITNEEGMIKKQMDVLYHYHEDGDIGLIFYFSDIG